MGKYTTNVQNVALEALRTGTSVDEAIADFRAKYNLDANDEPKVITFYRVEYRNRHNDKTHFGRPYKTEHGALKNRFNDAFIRAVRFDSVA